MNSIKIWTLLFIILLTVACKKDKKQEEAAPDHLKNGMLVLNEGLFQLNNSSLSWVDFSSGTVNNDFFTQKTGRLLGDTGNDMQRYGSKIYIVVNVSSTIEVLDAYTGKPIKQVTMQNGSTGKQPRCIAFYGNKAFIPCFDGYVDVLDTTSLEIIQRIKVGANPDAITLSGQRLFVSNSGGLNTPVMDSTVSVINAENLTEIGKIVVGKNPGSITTAANGQVYVIARGNYENIPSRMKRIHPGNMTVDKSYTFDASGIVKFKDKLLVSYYNYNTSTANTGLFNPASDQLENPAYLHLSNVQTFYGLYYNATQQKIYVKDAQGYTNTGYIRVYSEAGNYINSYHVGLNPNSILFYE